MGRLSARKFILDSGLCKRVVEGPGIYAITVNNRVVYIGQSINMVRRTRGHFRKIINGSDIPKYRLLEAAIQCNLKVDCSTVKCCEIEELNRLEKYYIRLLILPLNTMMAETSPRPENLSITTFLKQLRRCKKLFMINSIDMQKYVKK